VKAAALAQLAATQEQRRLDLLAHTQRIEAFTQQQADLDFLFRKVDNVSPEIAAMIEAHKRVILERLNTYPGGMGMTTGSMVAMPHIGNAVSVNDISGAVSAGDGDLLVGGDDLLVGNGDPLVRNGDPLVRNDDPLVGNDDPLVGDGDL
jgi:hypothetical protein